MTVYRIKDMKTGLYKTGGEAPNWSKHGKVWATQGHLILHLHIQARCDHIKPTWLIEELEPVVHEDGEVTVMSFFNNYMSTNRK